MRKAILFLCMAAGLVGCAKEVLNNENENVPSEGVPMTFNVTVDETETKAAKSGWGNGDKFRMPMSLEVEALMKTKDNTTDYTWTWCDGETVKYNDSTVKGLKIVRISTGAAIFFPITGEYVPAYNSPSKAAEFWTRTNTGSNLSRRAVIHVENETFSLLSYSRPYGFSVRPVFVE